MIAVDLRTFQQTREGGNVTGLIFLELPPGAFPDELWWDFPVTLLKWWTDEWLQFLTPARRVVQWRFLDGPYTATLTKGSNGGFGLGQVHSSLLSAAEKVIAHCEQQNFLGKDLECLRHDVLRLKANQPVQRAGASSLDYVEILGSRR